MSPARMTARAAKAAFSVAASPPSDCGACPRFSAYRNDNRLHWPDWHNAPVPIFGEVFARVLIVGLAPGLKGANRTGRPFTGDYAGQLLYETLADHGLAQGVYDARIDDGFELVDCAIINAVRCAPPQNKPTPAEIATCRPFLASALHDMRALRVIVALGRIAHESALRSADLRLAAHPFAHGAEHKFNFYGRPLTLIDSYHCSRYNTNTGVLTADMFRAIFARVKILSPA